MPDTLRKPIIEPGAADILHGADIQLIDISKRVRHAETLASRQTSKAKELHRRLLSNEPSLSLKAENERLRAELVDMTILAGIYRNGDQVLGDTLISVIAPTAGRFATRVTHDPKRLIRSMTERAEQRRQFIYDANGHRVRADLVDSANECSECRRERVRNSRAS